MLRSRLFHVVALGLFVLGSLLECPAADWPQWRYDARRSAQSPGVLPDRLHLQWQRDYEPLFDKFNVKLEGSWVGLSTQLRLDSELLGKGTTLSFEDDLDLDKNKIIPTLSFQWQIAKKHKLGFRWQDISRDSSAQALTEIQWGDEIIPAIAGI